MAFIPVSREQVTGGTGKQNWSSSSWGDGNSLLLVGAHTLAQLCCKKKKRKQKFSVYTMNLKSLESVSQPLCLYFQTVPWDPGHLSCGIAGGLNKTVFYTLIQHMLIFPSFCSAPGDIGALTLLNTEEGTQSF